MDTTSQRSRLMIASPQAAANGIATGKDALRAMCSANAIEMAAIEDVTRTALPTPTYLARSVRQLSRMSCWAPDSQIGNFPRRTFSPSGFSNRRWSMERHTYDAVGEAGSGPQARTVRFLSGRRGQRATSVSSPMETATYSTRSCMAYRQPPDR
jgi:hypothetical protein